MSAPTLDCGPGRESQATVGRSCASARKGMRMCESCWCSAHITFWVHLDRTVICGAGAWNWAVRGGKNAKKRALVAVARKLAVVLHKLWVTGEVYEALHVRRDGKTVAA